MSLGGINMEKVINVAQFIMDVYSKISGHNIDEMKLHKLLYLSQRESYAIMNEPLFQEDFEGWKYGPVCRIVRNEFAEDGLVCETSEISDEAMYIVKNVISQYGFFESWKLSELTHKETSWKNARIGLSSQQNGNRILSKTDIIKDSEKVRPYDSIWDMYYDEFEDSEIG